MTLYVKDLMSSNPRTISGQTTLREIIQIMRDEGCRHMPVLDEKEHLIGIVTDRDIRLTLNSPLVLHEKWQDEMLLENMTAAGCMTRDVKVISQFAPAVDAAKMLLQYRFGGLPVVDNGKLVGIITVTDFLNQFVFEHSKLEAS